MAAKCADPDEHGETLVIGVQIWETLVIWRWDMHWLGYEDVFMGERLIGAKKQKEEEEEEYCLNNLF